MSSGERPLGAATGKQSDTGALCNPPPPRVEVDRRSLLQGVLAGGRGGGVPQHKCALNLGHWENRSRKRCDAHGMGRTEGQR